MSLDRSRLVGQLAALPVHELVDVLRGVLPGHTEERNGIRTTLVLAEAYVSTSEPGPAELELVAWPDRDHYGGGPGPDQKLWESGRCGRCGLEVTSNAKRAHCPVCDSRCELT